MKIFVYLLEDNSFSFFYTGITSDIDRRLKEHNSGNVKATSGKKPFKLVWFKGYNSYSDARKHEKWLKKKNREYKLHLKEIGI